MLTTQITIASINPLDKVDDPIADGGPVIPPVPSRVMSGRTGGRSLDKPEAGRSLGMTEAGRSRPEGAHGSLIEGFPDRLLRWVAVHQHTLDWCPVRSLNTPVVACSNVRRVSNPLTFACTFIFTLTWPMVLRGFDLGPRSFDCCIFILDCGPLSQQWF